MKVLFTPNALLSKRAMSALIMGEVILGFLVWMLYPATFFPKPHEIIAAFGRLLENEFIFDLWASFRLNIEAIVITSIVSLVVVYLAVMPAFRPVTALIAKFRFNSFVGLTFFFGLAASGHALKLSLLVFAMTVWFVTAMAQVIDDIHDDEYDHARTLGMSEWRVTWEVVVLGRLDTAWETMRQNAAIGWMMLTMVEGIVRAEGGIGKMLLDNNRQLKLDTIFAIQIVVLVIAIGQDYLLGLLKRFLFPYANGRKV